MAKDPTFVEHRGGRFCEFAFFAPGDDLEGVLRAYLQEDRVYKHLCIHPDHPDIEVVRTVHGICNARSGQPFDALTIIRLAIFLATHYGGRVEPQMQYGSEGWTEFVRERLGLLVFWHKPTLNELRDLLAFGLPGLINGVEAEKRRPWFVGMSDRYLMPDKGLIRYRRGMTPKMVWEASGKATRLGPQWDRVAKRYRLCGLTAGYDVSETELRTELSAVLKIAKRLPWDLPVRAVEVLDRRYAAVPVINTWGDWVRLDFTPLALRDDGQLDREHDVEGVPGGTEARRDEGTE